MARRNSAVLRLSLLAVLCGLYALCMTSATHASEVERCVVVQHAHPAASGHLESHRRMIRAFPRASAPTSLFKTACVVTPNFAESLLARENVLALGDAPHAPGPGRAPPAV